MRSLATKLGVAGVVSAVGLAMLFWAVERASLINAAATRAGTNPDTGVGVLLLLMGGVLLLNAGVFFALETLRVHRRSHAPSRQAPVWLLVVIIVVAGGLGLTAFAAHTSDVNNAAIVSLDVDPWFVTGQVACAVVVVATLVVLGVRWAPRHRPARARG